MDARQSLAADKRAPRLILDDIEESSYSIMNLTSGIKILSKSTTTDTTINPITRMIIQFY